MADGSSIEWCDATWQPVLGCTRVSAGCDHCYAINVVHRGMSPQHRGLTKVRPKDASRPGLDWAGDIRLQPDRLAEPLHWRKPRRVFVCSLADLFHPGVPLEYVAAVFGVMAACPQHTFLVLTKRPARAREFFRWCERFGKGDNLPWLACGVAARHALAAVDETVPMDNGTECWPLPNVHLGTSVENQATADERVPLLLACPAAVHWVSAEPLLGPLDLASDAPAHRHALAWVVVGGESGRGARPFLIEWARQIVDDCRRAGVPVFVKQMGASPWLPLAHPTDVRRELTLRDRKGGDMHEWPADLRVRELPR